MGNNSQAEIKSIVARIEKLEEDKSAIAADIKEIYVEAKSNGFDVAALRAVIRARREDTPKREAREAIIETYLAALGDLASTPLGRAAIERIEVVQ